MKKQLSILDKAELAMKKAIKGVVSQHKKDNRPLSVWKNGKAVRIKAK